MVIKLMSKSCDKTSGTKINDLWEEIGSLAEDETAHVITRLYTMYEELLKKNPEDEHALLFFRNLYTAISQSTICNLNRR